MTIREAGKDNVVENLGVFTYKIGFNNGDQTELNAESMDELEELWLSLCPEFECKPDSVEYVYRNQRFVRCGQCGTKLFEGSHVLKRRGFRGYFCSEKCLCAYHYYIELKTLSNELLEEDDDLWEEE